jgi:hypothetical protein
MVVGLALVASRRAADVIIATAADKRQPYNTNGVREEMKRHDSRPASS